MFEKLEFQGKLWRIISKVDGNRLDNPSTLKESYGADMVIRSPQNIYFMVNKVIDVDFEDI